MPSLQQRMSMSLSDGLIRVHADGSSLVGNNPLAASLLSVGHSREFNHFCCRRGISPFFLF
ncbi:mCG1050917 [Mus musculus]|nr:mCG1050917 [Mus musculus]prf//0803245B ORF R-LTR [Mouse mammary tumor virus]